MNLKDYYSCLGVRFQGSGVRFQVTGNRGRDNLLPLTSYLLPKKNSPVSGCKVKA